MRRTILSSRGQQNIELRAWPHGQFFGLLSEVKKSGESRGNWRLGAELGDMPPELTPELGCWRQGWKPIESISIASFSYL